MTNLVDPATIEALMGQPRHPQRHIGLWDGHTVTIMHALWCTQLGRDIRDCPWSLALDAGRIHHMPLNQPIPLRLTRAHIHPEGTRL